MTWQIKPIINPHFISKEFMSRFILSKEISIEKQIKNLLFEFPSEFILLIFLYYQMLTHIINVESR